MANGATLHTAILLKEPEIKNEKKKEKYNIFHIIYQ